MHDATMTQGTYLKLNDDGSLEQITCDEDGIESNYIRIKDADK